MKYKNLQKVKKNKGLASSSSMGFIMLFTVMLISIILTIALGVSNVALKEINFSTSARNTNDAFLAADTASECTLLNDKSTINKFPLAGLATTISCAGNTSIPVTFSGTATTANYGFTIIGLGNSTQACAKVTISKDNSVPPMKTTIVSKGYNIGDASCNSSSPSRVERELDVTYGDSSPILPEPIGYWKLDDGS